MAEYSDDLVAEKIALACSYIDRTTRQWFESRERTISLAGTGMADMLLPAPPISITSVTVADEELDSDYWKVYMPTVPDSRMVPRLRMIGDVWTLGYEIEIEGSFGYVDDPGGGNTTPVEIVAAAILKTLDELGIVPENISGIDSESIGDYSYHKTGRIRTLDDAIAEKLGPFIRVVAMSV